MYSGIRLQKVLAEIWHNKNNTKNDFISPKKLF